MTFRPSLRILGFITVGCLVRHLPWIFLATVYLALAAHAQNPASNEARVTVYSSGDGLTLPEIIPIASMLLPIDECKKKIDGEVSLFFVVDTTGTPRNLLFDRPLGSDLDRFALQIVSGVRFRPGTLNGNPIIVAQKAKVFMQTCLIESPDGNGQNRLALQLRTMPKINNKCGAIQHRTDIS
jgi:hypothetical protein